jgi:hypothetical protein
LKINFLFFIYLGTIATLGSFIPRADFSLVFILFFLSFSIYFVICKSSNICDFSIRKGLFFTLLLRASLIFSIPALSDDFYRYLFDGHLLSIGANPFLSTPTVIVNEMNGQVPFFISMLYNNMNSPDYYSIYPPLHQVPFYIASFGGQSLLKNILILRFIIVAFDLLNIFLLSRILSLLNQPISKIWLYAFNPLIILELTGNLHFEGMVLTGILTMIYFFIKKRPGLSALGFSFAVGIKLTPLMIGPLLVLNWKKKKAISFVFFSGLVISTLLAPLFVSDGIQKFWISIRLFQSNFEFNASVYYLIKWFSGFFISYNPIAYVGPILNFAAFLTIVIYSAKNKGKDIEKLLIGIVHIYLIYLLSQIVVHPWYIIPAFGVSVLTNSKVFLAWTGLVFLSYYAYSHPVVKESTILLLVEYGILLIFILKEIPIIAAIVKRKF